MSFSKHLKSFNKISSYRTLSEDEILLLENSGNNSYDWGRIIIHKDCNIEHIQNNMFENDIVIGPNAQSKIIFSHLNNVIIGKNSSIKNNSLISNYIIGEESSIENSGHITAPEGFYDFEIKICNENGRRAVKVSPELSSTVIWLVSRRIIKQIPTVPRKSIGFIGNKVRIFNLSLGKNLYINDNASIINANCIDNVFIDSDSNNTVEITHIISLNNAIIKKSCEITKGVIGENLFIDENSSIKNGSRIFHVYLGSNSTIACCEVLNSFISSFHEQHHNNSFLIASSILGQSNIAAGATIGSNHNSRSADGEIIAARGFWPGLNVSLKHNSYFAGFTMIAKGSYPFEIYNPFPFSLIYRDKNQLSIRPAFILKYNSYALHRNSWKFLKRDLRKTTENTPLYHFIGPDTVCETLKAIKFLTDKKLIDNNLGFFEKSKNQVIIIDSENSVQLYKNKLIYFLSLEILREILIEKNSLPDNNFNFETEWVFLGEFSIRKDTLVKIKSFNYLHSNDLTSFMSAVLIDEQKLVIKYYASVLLNILNFSCLNNLLKSKEWISQIMDMHIKEKKEVLYSLQKDSSEKFRKITFLYNETPDEIYGSSEDNHFIKDYFNEHEIIFYMLKNYLSSIS